MNIPRTYIGASLVAIAIILFWILLMPMYDSVMIQRDALAERETTFNTRNDIINNLKSLTQEYAQRSTDIARFASIIPAQKRAPELISSIQALATQNGLQLTTMSLSGTGANAQTTNPYQEQTINVGLSGNYPSFKLFLMALERNIRIIDITSISANPSSDNSPIINFTILGKAYYIK